MVGTQSEIIFDYLTPFLFSSPITLSKIDIITNNAEFIGPNIYYKESLENVIEFLFN